MYTCYIQSFKILASFCSWVLPGRKSRRHVFAWCGSIINQCFSHKNGNRRFKYIVLGYAKTYCVKDQSDVTTKYFETDVIRMLDFFFIDNIFVEFGRRIFQQTVGIPMVTNCAPLLADLFLYSYEADFVQGLTKAGKNALSNNQIYRWRTVSKQFKFSEYLDFIYPSERNQRNYWVLNICFIPGLFLVYGQWEAKYSAVWQERRFQFCYSQLSFWVAIFLLVQHTEFMFHN